MDGRGGPALRLSAVAKSYGRTPVLRSIDLAVPAGEAVALVGDNGSGKTTLLRVASTLARPASGQVEVAGVDALGRPDAARAKLSLLTQGAPLYPELTAREHVRWWARAQAMPSPGASRLLDDAGLGGCMERNARDLSRGQRQRLALVLALLPDRPLLLLDEPFAALDDDGREWLEEELATRRGRQAVLLSVHDAAQARRLAGQVVRLRDGRLEATA